MTKQFNPLYLKLFIVSSLLICVLSCSNNALRTHEVRSKGLAEEQTYDYSKSVLMSNASQWGSKVPEHFVLMQNRMGIRIEYNIDRSQLQLWISPSPKTSTSYYDRNFSSRDDHCDLFDLIKIPSLQLGEFVSCDYGAFYSVLHFKNQKLFILNLLDQPAIMVWLEKDGNVDFKTKGGDKELVRDAQKFLVEHSERGKTFEYAAFIGSGEGKFRHQLVLESGRSTYARAELKGGQPIIISGALKGENVANLSTSLLSKGKEMLLTENIHKIEKLLANGKMYLNGKPEIQKLIDVNKETALSMQDYNGFLRSTNQFIYYLTWTRDGGMNATHLAFTGWAEPARGSVNYLLQNPSVSKEKPCEGIYFGQLVSPNINKWEEDGIFYVIWPAFTHWTLTDDDTYVKGKNLQTMEAGMDWVERYCFDKAKGLFKRYYFCETPYSGSRDQGWDNAKGMPTDFFDTKYKDSVVVASYDIYINNLCYSSYIMLAAMETSAKANEYMAKAKALEVNIKKFYDYKGNLPAYGQQLTKAGNLIDAAPYGMDYTDYEWSLSLPPFTPTLPEKIRNSKNQLFQNMRAKPEGRFICSWAAILTSMDNAIFSEDSIMAAIDYLTPQCTKPGKYLVMANTIPEIVDVEDGDPFHDVRPIIYSSAPYTSAVSGLGVRKLPFGLAVRGTKYLSKIDNFEYKGGLINFKWDGKGAVNSVSINGAELKGTLQIPDNLVKKGENQVVVKMGGGKEEENLMISSTVNLKSVSANVYTIYAYGKNVLTFKNLSKKPVVKCIAQPTVPVTSVKDGNFTYIEFEGRGEYTVELL